MKNLIWIILILSSFNLLSQISPGQLDHCENGYLNFLPNNRLDFVIERNGCMGEEKYIGEGNYKIRNDIIIIYVETHNKDYESSIIQFQDSNFIDQDAIRIIVKDENNKPVPFVNISYKRNPKTFSGTSTDEYGNAILVIPPTVDSDLKISLLGYAPASIPINRLVFNSIEVILKAGNVIFLDNKKVKLRINMNEKENKFTAEIIKIKQKLATTRAQK